MTRAEIIGTAERHGFRLVDEQPEIGLLIFGRDGVRVNVYSTTMTVATCLNHPLKGRTQLFRRRVGLGLLERIFENPRVHTDRGYREKHHSLRRRGRR
jgi:hypothetical protein